MSSKNSSDEDTFCIILSHPTMVNKMKVTIAEHNYNFVRQIGSGGFSVVFLCESTKYHQEFVIKVREYKKKADTESEIVTLMNLSHPNIIQMFEYFTDFNFLYIVLEYCPGGSLSQYIQENGPLRRSVLYPLCAHILSALQLCHKNNIAHRDIKPDNILIDSHGRPKLADFGLSSYITTDVNSFQRFGGSRPFMSPEIIKKKAHDAFKADIWALGVTFYQCVVGDLPWSTESVADMEVAITMGMVSFNGVDVDYEMVRLIKDMIEVNTTKRASVDSLLAQPIMCENIGQTICLLGRNNDHSNSGNVIAIPRKSTLIGNKVRRSSMADKDIMAFQSLPIGHFPLSITSSRMNNIPKKPSQKILQVKTFF